MISIIVIIWSQYIQCLLNIVGENLASVADQYNLRYGSKIYSRIKVCDSHAWNYWRWICIVFQVVTELNSALWVQQCAVVPDVPDLMAILPECFIVYENLTLPQKDKEQKERKKEKKD